MTENIRVVNRFEYHLEDLGCSSCLYSKRKSKKHKHGCREGSCRFEDIRREAVGHGRIERVAGWFKCRE